MNILSRIFRRRPDAALAASEPAVVVAPAAPVKAAALPVSQSPSPAGPESSPGLGRIIRPQALNRWSLPMLGALTPQYIEMLLRSAMAGSHMQQWELFDLMQDTWPELAACKAELIGGVMGRELTFSPYTEEDEEPTDSAKEKQRLVSAALRTMRPDVAADENDLDATLHDIASGWFVGVSVLEVLWESRTLGQLGTCTAPLATVWVHPANYGFAGGVLGLRPNPMSAGAALQSPTLSFAQQQGTAGALAPFPPNKFLLGIHKAKSGTVPAGALLRPLAWWWCAANFSADWLLRLAEIFGLPFRWAEYDPNAPDAVVSSICNMLQGMGSAGWAAFPTGTKLEMKEPSKGGSDHSPQGELLDRADRYARLLVLGQTQSGGKGSSMGGQAFGKVEEGVKEQRIESCADYIAGVLNAQFLPQILALNYGPACDECPRVEFVTKEEDDLVAFSTVVQNLAAAGAGRMFGLDFLRKKFGVPKPADDEETLEKPAPASTAPMPPKPGEAKPAQDPEEKTDPMLAKDIRSALRIEDDATFQLALTAIIAGDAPGHEFRGNQWTSPHSSYDGPKGNPDAESHDPHYIRTTDAVAYARKKLGDKFAEHVKNRPGGDSEDPMAKASAVEGTARDTVRAGQRGEDPHAALEKTNRTLWESINRTRRRIALPDVGPFTGTKQ